MSLILWRIIISAVYLPFLRPFLHSPWISAVCVCVCVWFFFTIFLLYSFWCQIFIITVKQIIMCTVPLWTFRKVWILILLDYWMGHSSRVWRADCEMKWGGREGGSRCCPRPHSLPGCSLFLIPGKTWPTWLEFIFKTTIPLVYISSHADIAYDLYVWWTLGWINNLSTTPRLVL